MTRVHEADKKSAVLYQSLKFAVRERERLITERTAHECVLHTYIDSVFPGFLNEKKSGIWAFSSGSLEIMARQDFSAQAFARKTLAVVQRIIEHTHISSSVKVANKLLILAKSSLQMNSELLVSMQQRLQMNLAIFIVRQKAIDAEERTIASLLAQTRGFYLTSIPGISIILAAKIMAKLSDSAHSARLFPARLFQVGYNQARLFQVGYNQVGYNRTVDIEKIRVFNRADFLGKRLNGFMLNILDEKRQVVFSKEIPKAQPINQFGK
jgi:hypothetical protein